MKLLMISAFAAGAMSDLSLLCEQKRTLRWSQFPASMKRAESMPRPLSRAAAKNAIASSSTTKP